MNPALDITTDTDVVVPTDKMRCSAVRYDPGGGGINVARVARVLGATVAAVFPAGGTIGDLVTQLLAPEAAPGRRVRIAGPTRESFHREREQQRQAIPVCATGPVGHVRGAGRLPQRIARGGGHRGFRGRERESATQRSPGLLPAGRRHLPGARCAPDSGHLRRRACAHHRRGVPAEAQRARASRMCGTGAWQRVRPAGRGTRADRSRVRREHCGVAWTRRRAACHTPCQPTV